jgi:hypothetical protein
MIAQMLSYIYNGEDREIYCYMKRKEAEIL